jgi:hypothetical protein
MNVKSISITSAVLFFSFFSPSQDEVVLIYKGFAKIGEEQFAFVEHYKIQYLLSMKKSIVGLKLVRADEKYLYYLEINNNKIKTLKREEF